MMKLLFSLLTPVLLLTSPVVAQNPEPQKGSPVLSANNPWSGQNWQPFCPLAFANPLVSNGINCASNGSASPQFNSVTLTGNTTFQMPVGLKSGEVMTYRFMQDATGGRTLALPTDGSVTAPAVNVSGGKLSLTSAPGAVDTITCYGFGGVGPTWIATRMDCPGLAANFIGGGGFAVVSGATATCASSGGAACTTSSANFNNVTLVVGCIGLYSGNGASSTLSDNLGNSYTQIYTVTTGPRTGRMFYSKPSSVSGTMTFTASNTGGSADASPGLTVMGFSGPFTTPLDQSNNTGSAGASVTSIQPGSITPTLAGELLASCLTVSTSTTGGQAITPPFTLGPVINSVPGNAEGSAIGYQIQTSASAQNPTWSFTGSGVATAGIASFK